MVTSSWFVIILGVERTGRVILSKNRVFAMIVAAGVLALLPVWLRAG
jgi:hypothetical protein